MDDSDDEIMILPPGTSRATRMEKRNQLTREELERNRADEYQAAVQEEAEQLRRAIELSRIEAEAEYEQWEEHRLHSDKGEKGRTSQRPDSPLVEREDADRSQHQQEEGAELAMDEEALLENQNSSSDDDDDDKQSVQSEILLDSEVEEEVVNEKATSAETSGCSNPNLSRSSGASVTFPANNLNRRPIRMEEEEEVEQETQLLDPESWAEPEVKTSRDEAGIGGRECGQEDEFNASQDLFSQGGQESQMGDVLESEDDAVEGEGANHKEDSDEDFVMAEEHFPEENEVRKSSRLSLKRKRGPEEEVDRTTKATRTEDDNEDEEGVEELESTEDRERQLKEELERLVNDRFTLMQSQDTVVEEQLHDSRKSQKPSKPYYCPLSVRPEEYSVAIVQMFQCYLKRLKSHRLVNDDGRMRWGNPVCTGPHLARYPLLRRRGFKGPPSSDDDDESDLETGLVEGQKGETVPAEREGKGRGHENERGNNPKKPARRINRYVLDEDDDDVSDFQPVKVPGRRKQIMDSDLCSKRPRSEPQTFTKYLPHPIVRPRPLKRQPINPRGNDDQAPVAPRTSGKSANDRGRPPTPTGDIFDFAGDSSPVIHSPAARNHSQASGSSPRKLHRSSSNPELGSLAGAEADKLSGSQGIDAALDTHPKDINLPGPSRRVAYVQPSGPSSPWISKATARGSTSSGFVPLGDMEGGFVREDTQQMDTQELPPALDHRQVFAGNPVGSPPGAVPTDSPGIECPLCGQKFPLPIIEAHASECDGTISLDDAVGNREPIHEEPPRTDVTSRPSHTRNPPEDIPRPKGKPHNNENNNRRQNRAGISSDIRGGTGPTEFIPSIARMTTTRQDTRNSDIRQYGISNSGFLDNPRADSARPANEPIKIGRNHARFDSDGHASSRSAGSRSRQDGNNIEQNLAGFDNDGQANSRPTGSRSGQGGNDIGHTLAAAGNDERHNSRPAGSSSRQEAGNNDIGRTRAGVCNDEHSDSRLAGSGSRQGGRDIGQNRAGISKDEHASSGSTGSRMLQEAGNNDIGRTRAGSSRMEAGSTGARPRDLKVTRTRNAHKDSRPKGAADGTHLDHLDATILQLMENKEIEIVEPPKRRRLRAPRAKREDTDDDDVIEIEDFNDDAENRPERKGKAVKERREKCFLCGKMIPKAVYASHIDQHQELKGPAATRSSPEEEPIRVGKRVSPADRLTNGDSSSDDHHLRQLYGAPGSTRGGSNGPNLEDSPGWTQPGFQPPSDEEGPEGDSPIKAYQSIKDTNSVIDFKNQFKESNTVKSRTGGRSRGGRRGRGRGRRGRGRRKKGY